MRDTSAIQPREARQESEICNSTVNSDPAITMKVKVQIRKHDSKRSQQASELSARLSTRLDLRSYPSAFNKSFPNASLLGKTLVSAIQTSENPPLHPKRKG